MRIGSGHDSHRLETGRPLIIGGVVIPFHRGLVGHSDADVVLHSLTDAILGALALGDIGEIFPDDDPRYKDANSQIFMQHALTRMDELGWQIVNADVTIFAQEPKLGSFKQIIRTNVARILKIKDQDVNIKAKTGEKVGHIGRAEAIACHAVILLQNKN